MHELLDLNQRRRVVRQQLPELVSATDGAALGGLFRVVHGGVIEAIIKFG